MEGLRSIVSADDNAFLLREFIEAEITIELFQMDLSKVLGPDGFSPGFFQTFWEVVKEDVVAPCLSFLNGGGVLPTNMNFTHIMLIPK